MKFIVPFALLASAVCFSGCESFSDAADSVKEKLASREETRTKVFTAEPRATYEAVRLAADQMGYRFLHGGAAQGKFEAVSGLASDDSLHGSRQISMKVALHATLDGGTEVSVTLDEILESNSGGHGGQGVSAPLRDTPQYDVFFRRIQQALDVAKK